MRYVPAAYNYYGHVPQLTSYNLPEGRHTYRGRSYADHYIRPPVFYVPAAGYRYDRATVTYTESRQESADACTCDNNSTQLSHVHSNDN